MLPTVLCLFLTQTLSLSHTQNSIPFTNHRQAEEVNRATRLSLSLSLIQSFSQSTHTSILFLYTHSSLSLSLSLSLSQIVSIGSAVLNSFTIKNKRKRLVHFRPNGLFQICFDSSLFVNRCFGILCLTLSLSCSLLRRHICEKFWKEISEGNDFSNDICAKYSFQFCFCSSELLRIKKLNR